MQGPGGLLRVLQQLTCRLLTAAMAGDTVLEAHIECLKTT